MSDAILNTYGRFPVTFTKGQGSRLWDADGKKYLDFCMGIAVCSLGHCHPVVTETLKRQAEELIHVSNLYHTQPAVDLAQLITELVGVPGKTFFSNSGAEANDGLIKLARKFGQETPDASGQARYEILTFRQSFHGRTLGGIAATGQQKVKEGFDPLLPGFCHLPFGDLEALAAALNSSTCAVLLEPLQGEGGIHAASAEYLEGVAQLCNEHNVLLMFDEVQCGFGRLGDMMAWRALGAKVQPDAISWAKGMGGGVPIGAFWVSDRLVSSSVSSPLSSLLGPGSHGSTYGGNPLVAATSFAVLREIQAQGLAANAVAREEQIRAELHAWNHSSLVEVRGKGLMLGIEFEPEGFAVPSGQTLAVYLCNQLLKAGLLVPPAGANTIRFLPALNITAEDVDEAISTLRATIESLVDD